MEFILPKFTNKVITLVVAMQDLLIAEMISEWHFSSNFRTLAILDNGHDIIKKINKLKPDFIIVDSELNRCQPLDLPTHLKELNLPTKIILYATKQNNKYLEYFLDENNDKILGFIHKGCGIDELERCLVEVFNNHKYLSTKISQYLNQKDSSDAIKNSVLLRKADLSKRELQVWHQMSDGKSNREIAKALHIEISTVKTHKVKIKEKLFLTQKDRLGYIAIQNK